MDFVSNLVKRVVRKYINIYQYILIHLFHEVHLGAKSCVPILDIKYILHTTSVLFFQEYLVLRIKVLERHFAFSFN